MAEEFKNVFNDRIEHNVVLNKNASVVELTAARKILFMLNYRMRLDSTDVDKMMLFKAKCEKGNDKYFEYACYAAPKNRSDDTDKYPKRDRVGSLYIDEGTFSSTLRVDGTLSTSDTWDQLVDFRELLMYITRALLPEVKHPQSGAIGRGRYQQELISGYYELLKDNENITWVE